LRVFNTILLSGYVFEARRVGGIRRGSGLRGMSLRGMKGRVGGTGAAGRVGGIRLRSGLRRDIFSSTSWWLLEENIKGLWFLTEHPPHGVH
jgi:hypothetical protein